MTLSLELKSEWWPLGTEERGRAAREAGWATPYGPDDLDEGPRLTLRAKGS